jgi:hypothetical protein
MQHQHRLAAGVADGGVVELELVSPVWNLKSLAIQSPCFGVG